MMRPETPGLRPCNGDVKIGRAAAQQFARSPAVREAQARAERERDSAKPQVMRAALNNRPPLPTHAYPSGRDYPKQSNFGPCQPRQEIRKLSYRRD